MSPSFVRFFLTASLAAALCGSMAARAQSTGSDGVSLIASSSSAPLPDAPSASLPQQQQTQQQPVPPLSGAPAQQPSSSGQQKTPGSQTTAPGGTNPSGEATREEPLPGETPEQFKARQKADAAAQVKKEEGQRNLYVLPNFNTVVAGETPPLSPGQKFDLVYHTAKDPYTFTIAFIVAGIGEAEDSHVGYHWGPAGYFRRVGAAYGDNVDGAIWGNAILPVLLHQDPRYYRKGPGHPILTRILWSAASTILCYGDNGRLQPNISNVGGNIISGAISNLYYPDDERGIGLVFSNTLTVTAEGAAGAQLLEFGPDLTALLERRRLRHAARRAAKKAAAAGQPATPPVTPQTQPSPAAAPQQ